MLLTKTIVKFYQRGWALIEQFMLENSIEFYEVKVGDAFLSSIFDKRSFSELTRKEKDIIRCVNVLTEYQTTGIINFRSVRKPYHFEGEIGNLILGFLIYRKSQGMSEDTVTSNKLYLHRLLGYLNSNQVLNILRSG
ncbi:hypothetical protein ACOI1C_19465 [Bacillus sp. DJP31]|uniref:hypothetical protein n=1 Tax=Bacillus sp. DJP31 TaxID=3409789 RepID=UPI003BB6B571